MLTDNGKSSLNVFCQSVPAVTAASAIKEAAIPTTGSSLPPSKPRTISVPKNPNIMPIHCRQVTTSFNNGPAKMAVKIG